MNSTPIINQVYKHYKCNYYQVVFICKHSDTLETMIVYKNVDKPECNWVRPLSEFISEVEINGEMIKRFTKC